MGRGSSPPGDLDKLGSGFGVDEFLGEAELGDATGVGASLGRLAGAGVGSAAAVVEESAT